MFFLQEYAIFVYMDLTVIDLAKKLFKNDISGFLAFLKQNKLNNDTGPTKDPLFGNVEVEQLMRYFERYYGDKEGETIFMPYMPGKVPDIYVKDTMRKTAYCFKDYPAVYCCASGDLVILRRGTHNGKKYWIPFYLELKIADNTIRVNDKGIVSWETASIPRTTVENFKGNTVVAGMTLECPHLYLLVPKVIGDSRGKICIVNATELRKISSTLNYIKTEYYNSKTQQMEIKESLLYKDIPDRPELKVDLNDWVAEEEASQRLGF